ncbi:hypothetical protein [Bradyrhizobium sp. AC87j1]|uniref:hypothetical protein n=1 Tax=Bradyrhizobium sp. AC87j1 TaxID=2055894 RepID=UPI0011B0BABC|nr:hypothetical protein [Bradyrhizobium sp. AC87j1]
MLSVVALIVGISAAHSGELGRCAPLDFASNGEFRNVTESGDVRIGPGDKVVLINKRKPEATRVVFDRATRAYSSVVIVKDCSGTARDSVVTISGEIDAGEISIDGNWGSIGFRRVGSRWMIQ